MIFNVVLFEIDLSEHPEDSGLLRKFINAGVMTKREIYHNKFLVKEVPDVNQLQVLLKLFPEEKWDWGKTSDNPNTTIEVVLEHPNGDWNWKKLSVNPNMTWEIVKRYPQLGWHYKEMAKNPESNIANYSK